MKMYLQFLNENFMDKYDAEERPEIKDYISKHNFVYLYHGTSAKNLERIKVEGLKHTIRYNKIDDGHWLYFSSNKLNSFFYSRSSFFSFGRDLQNYILLVKLDTKILKFMRNYDFTGNHELESLNATDEYVYDRDIPFKDILLPDSPQYKKIELSSKYLIQKGLPKQK